MYTKVKRIMSMALALCMVFSMMPMTAFAETVGGVESPQTLPKGQEPAAAPSGYVWSAAEPVGTCEHAGKADHTHVQTCYVKTCGHGDAHTESCYTWAQCAHDSSVVHVYTKTGADAHDSIRDPAYSAAHAVYEPAYNAAFSAAEQSTEAQKVYDDKKAEVEEMGFPASLGANAAAVAAKAAYCADLANKAGNAALANVIFCCTAESRKCGHGDSHVESCYSDSALNLSVCPGYEHTHTDACYSVTWTLKADSNNNGKVDDSEYYTVTYISNGETVHSESVLLNATTPVCTDPVRDGYRFIGWEPTVASTVTENATYTAKWEAVPVVNIQAATISYEDFQTITDWDTKIREVMRISVTCGDTTLTEPVVTLSLPTDFQAGNTYTITASYAGVAGTYAPASASADLTIQAAPGQSTIKMTGNAVVTVKDASSNEVKLDDGEDTAGVMYEQSVTISAVAADPTYKVTGITITGGVATQNEDGTYTVKATSYDGETITVAVTTEQQGMGTVKLTGSNHDKATITVNGQSVPAEGLSFPGGTEVTISVRVDDPGYYFTGFDFASEHHNYGYPTSTSAPLTVVEGQNHEVDIDLTEILKLQDHTVTAKTASEAQISRTALLNAMLVDGSKDESSITKVEKQEGDSYTEVTGDTISGFGTYRVTVTYSDPEYKLTPDSYSTTATLTITDARPQAVINVKSGVEIGYKGETIDEAKILAAVLDSVTVNDAALENADVSLANTLGVKIWKKDSLTGRYLTPNGSSISSGGLLSGLTGVTGEYKVTLQFAGNDSCTAAQNVDAYFSVYDARPSVTVSMKDSLSLDMPTLDTKFTEAQILEKLELSITDEDNNTLATHSDYSTKELVEVKIYKGIDLSNDLTEITEAGTYSVTVTYKESTANQKGTKTVRVAVNDARHPTAITLNDGSVDIDALDDTFTADNVLDAMDFEVTYTQYGVENDTPKIVTENVDTYTNVTIKDLLPNADGTYTFAPDTEYEVTVEYAKNDNHNNYRKAQAVTKKLTVNDKRIETTVNLNPYTVNYYDVDWTAEETYTAMEAFELVKGEHLITNANDAEVTYEAETLDITMSGIPEGATGVNQIGVYNITVKYSGDNTHKPSEATVTFTISDGRATAVISVNKDQEIPYEFSIQGVDAEKLDELLAVTVTGEENTALVKDTDYTVTLIDANNTSVEPTNMVLDGVYTVTVEIKDHQKYMDQEETATFTVKDLREEPVLTLTDASVSYKTSYTQKEIYDLFNVTLANAEGEAITVNPPAETALLAVEDVKEIGDMGITYDGSELNVGEYTFTVSFSGDYNYLPVSENVKLTITKAQSSVSVIGTTQRWSEGGYAISNMISASPDGDPELITFAVGIDLGESREGDTQTVAYVNLPPLFDSDSTLGAGIQDAINGLAGQGYTISGLSQRLREILQMADAELPFVGGTLADLINLNTESINQLVSALEQIENTIPGSGEMTIYVSIGSGITVHNSGLYAVGAVVSDANYETSYGLNYLMLHPDGYKAEIEWKVADENGIYTLEKIQNGNHDLDAYVASVEQGTIEDAEKALAVKFMGVDINGDPVIIDIKDAQEKLTIGAYTEVAYFENLGNTMYYDDPIMRPVVIISDLVEVKLYDENGVENYDYLTIYDKEPHEMTAVAYRRGTTEKLGDAVVNYVGVASDGTLYNSTTAPTTTGTYTVTATFSQDADNDGTPEYVGAGAAVMIIQPATASIGVADLTTATYPETISISQVVGQPSDPDAKYAVMVAGISDVGDFSENGLSAVNGVVLVDFPDRVDSVLNTVLGKTEFTAADFKAVLAPLAAALEGAGIDVSEYSDILDQIAALPGEVTVKLTNLGGYTFQNPGAWIVMAGIMDNNYVPTMDMGLVVIAPDATEYVLDWNYTDDNGIITRPVLEMEGVDLLAHADDAEGAKNADVTDMIEYVVYGFTTEGEEVRIYGTANEISNQIKALENGVYTQVAYIPATISANIPYAEPISRQIILTPQYVIVTAPEETFEYTGSPVDYKVTVKYADKSEATKGELTVNYVGVNGTDGAYNSTEVPTNVGVYAVTAEYRESDENGELKYFGMDLGSITITPKTLVYDIQDTTKLYNSKHQLPDIKNPDGASDILFIVDTENARVNIIAPSVTDTGNWDGDLSIKFWVEKLNEALTGLNGSDAKTILQSLLNELPEAVTGDAKFQEIVNVLTTIDSDMIYLNSSDFPVEVGTYTAYGIAFKDANHTIALSQGTLKIIDEHDHADYLEKVSTDDATCTKASIEHYKCTFPDCTHTEDKTVGKPLGHLFSNNGKWFYDQEAPAEGHYELCERNGCDAAGDIKVHNFTDWKKPLFRSTAQEYRECTDCGYTETRTVHVHDLKCVEIKDDDTNHSVVCDDKDCDMYGKELYQEKHNYGKWIRVKTPTETEKGLKYRECECCGHRQWKEISMVFNASTGDTIMIAVGVMVASAAALAVLLIRKKKKTN